MVCMVQLSRRVADLQDKFINILVNLSDHLPRMQNYINTFSDRDRIREKLAAVYTEIMQLLILAVDFFGKKGRGFPNFGYSERTVPY